ncbi:histidine kinase [Saccharomonospora piscinae]|nr:histidine kinase [Saccharomonospora piscinae]
MRAPARTLREVNDDQPDGTRKGLHRLRRYTWWSLAGIGYLAALPVLQSVADRTHTAEILVPAVLTTVLTIVQRMRFVSHALRERVRHTGPTAEHLATFAVATAIWCYAIVVVANPTSWAFAPALLAGGILSNTAPGRRLWLTLALALTTATAGLVAASGRDDASGAWWPWVLAGLAAAFVVTIVVIDVAQLWFWDMVVEIDRARAMAEELAVARERLRFAAELHDVQGHHLQAILLKGELAERLIGRDDDAARAHAAELTELARTALTDTRTVVHGYRATTLHSEIANAVDVLAAAGIETEVRGAAREVPPPLQALFGSLVREGTTNILRHTHASSCTLTLDTGGDTVRVRLANDGVTPGPARPGSGIAGLRERFAALGGDVAARVTGSGEAATFELGGHAPARR